MAWLQSAQCFDFLFDFLIELVQAEHMGNADGIFDGFSSGTAVANNGDTPDSQQWGPSGLCVIDPRLEILERPAGQQAPELGNGIA